MADLPDVIKKVGFDNGWDVKAVWSAQLPVETISIDELLWHFDIPFWNTAKGWYDLSVNEVINNPGKHKLHIDRIEACDTSYPIDICLNPKTGKWTILDGLHRLAKLARHGATKIEVRKFKFEQVPWESRLTR